MQNDKYWVRVWQRLSSGSKLKSFSRKLGLCYSSVFCCLISWAFSSKVILSPENTVDTASSRGSSPCHGRELSVSSQNCEHHSFCNSEIKKTYASFHFAVNGMDNVYSFMDSLPYQLTVMFILKSREIPKKARNLFLSFQYLSVLLSLLSCICEIVRWPIFIWCYKDNEDLS